MSHFYWHPVKADKYGNRTRQEHIVTQTDFMPATADAEGNKWAISIGTGSKQTSMETRHAKSISSIPGIVVGHQIKKATSDIVGSWQTSIKVRPQKSISPLWTKLRDSDSLLDWNVQIQTSTGRHVGCFWFKYRRTTMHAPYPGYCWVMADKYKSETSKEHIANS